MPIILQPGVGRAQIQLNRNSTEAVVEVLSGNSMVQVEDDAPLTVRALAGASGFAALQVTVSSPGSRTETILAAVEFQRVDAVRWDLPKASRQKFVALGTTISASTFFSDAMGRKFGPLAADLQLSLSSTNTQVVEVEQSLHSDSIEIRAVDVGVSIVSVSVEREKMQQQCADDATSTSEISDDHLDISSDYIELVVGDVISPRAAALYTQGSIRFAADFDVPEMLWWTEKAHLLAIDGDVTGHASAIGNSETETEVTKVFLKAGGLTTYTTVLVSPIRRIVVGLEFPGVGEAKRNALTIPKTLGSGDSDNRDSRVPVHFFASVSKHNELRLADQNCHDSADNSHVTTSYICQNINYTCEVADPGFVETTYAEIDRNEYPYTFCKLVYNSDARTTPEHVSVAVSADGLSSSTDFDIISDFELSPNEIRIMPGVDDEVQVLRARREITTTILEQFSEWGLHVEKLAGGRFRVGVGQADEDARQPPVSGWEGTVQFRQENIPQVIKLKVMVNYAKYARDRVYLTVGKPMPVNEPSLPGGLTALRFSSSAELPAGINLDTHTGVLDGTPRKVMKESFDIIAHTATVGDTEKSENEIRIPVSCVYASGRRTTNARLL
jgi:hypothetical protein